MEELKKLFEFNKDVALIALAQMAAGDFDRVTKKSRDNLDEKAPIDHVKVYLLWAMQAIQKIQGSHDEIVYSRTINEIIRDFLVASEIYNELKKNRRYSRDTLSSENKKQIQDCLDNGYALQKKLSHLPKNRSKNDLLITDLKIQVVDVFNKINDQYNRLVSKAEADRLMNDLGLKPGSRIKHILDRVPKPRFTLPKIPRGPITRLFGNRERGGDRGLRREDR